MRINCFGHLGDGNLHYNVFPARGRRREDYDDRRAAIQEAVHQMVVDRAGSFSAEHGVGRLKTADLARWGDPARLAAMLVSRVKVMARLDIAERRVFLTDPMLATGGSLVHAIRLLQERGADNITCICMVAAEPGVQALKDADLPVTRLVTATIDPSLNEDAYIVPGLGDAGDRLYGPRNIDL